jgi:uncharacterized protein YecT (DUF1311 family)
MTQRALTHLRDRLAELAKQADEGEPIDAFELRHLARIAEEQRHSEQEELK